VRSIARRSDWLERKANNRRGADRRCNCTSRGGGARSGRDCTAGGAPVCRDHGFGKFKYREAKRQHEAKLKLKQIQVKEVKFRPSTDEGDYKIKLRNLIRYWRGRQGQSHTKVPWA